MENGDHQFASSRADWFAQRRRLEEALLQVRRQRREEWNALEFADDITERLDFSLNPPAKTYFEKKSELTYLQ